MKLTEEQEQWLQALESGEYKQGRTYLNKNGCMCCLGVACEILIPDTVTGDLVKSYGTGKDKESTMAPKMVIDILGLNDEFGALNLDRVTVHKYTPKDAEKIQSYGSLASMNDGVELSFKEIAEFIRWAPEVVFTKGAE